MSFLYKFSRFAGWVNYASFLTLVATLPYPWRTAHTIWIVWMVTWVLEGRWLNRDAYQIKKHNIPFALFTLLFVWELLSLTWAADVASGWAVATRHISLPILLWVSIIGVNNHYKTEHIRSVWYITTAISLVAYMIFTAPENTIEGWGLAGERKHKLFYCMNIILALCSTPFLYRLLCRKLSKWAALIIMGVGTLWLLNGIYLEGSRTSPVTLTCLLVMYITYWVCNRYWHRHKVAILSFFAGMILLLGIGGYLFFNYYPRMEHIADDPRMVEWSTILNHHDEYGLFGMGIGQQRAFLVQRYTEIGYDSGITEQFSSHNAYFGSWMCLGPIAPFLLIACFLSLPFCFKSRAKHYLFFVAMLYMLNMLTDDLMERIDPLLTLYTCMVIAMVMRQESLTARQIS